VNEKHKTTSTTTLPTLPKIPQFAMAGAGFASLLVIVSIPTPSPSLIAAAGDFALGVPVIIGGAFIPAFLGTDALWLRIFLGVAQVCAFIFGDIWCGIGIWWMFRHISADLSLRFEGTAVFCWVAASVIFLVTSAIRERRARNNETSASTH
jgi:hypothetical protein